MSRLRCPECHGDQILERESGGMVVVYLCQTCQGTGMVDAPPSRRTAVVLSVLGLAGLVVIAALLYGATRADARALRAAAEESFSPRGAMRGELLRPPGASGGAPAAAPVIPLAGAAALVGYATWYDAHKGHAAAGPGLRAAIGPDWRGTVVTVAAGGASVAAVLSDWCACGPRHGQPTLIDLSREDFAELADPVLDGIVLVTVQPRGGPPPTDVKETP